MYFDDPITLDYDAFVDLMADTEQRRLCWMYHEALSDRRIAGLFADQGGAGRPDRRAETAMAWVAAGRRENSLYLLFKWYADFCGPPARGDLYYIRREQGPDRPLRIHPVRMNALLSLGRQGQAMCQDLWHRIGENAIEAFGETEFETTAIQKLLTLLDGNPGRELPVFDWYLGRGSDGQKAAQCATIAAYFQAVQTVRDLLYETLVDGEEADWDTRSLLSALRRLTGELDEKRLSELTAIFQDLADQFCWEPLRGPSLSSAAGRTLLNRTTQGDLLWVRLQGQGKRRLLRELYCRCAPRQVREAFQPWPEALYFTVVRPATLRELPRGVYLACLRTEAYGRKGCDLFWLEHVDGGSVHLCAGDWLGELPDHLPEDGPAITLHGGPRRTADLPGAYAALLKEAYDRLEQRGYRQPDGRDQIY